MKELLYLGLIDKFKTVVKTFPPTSIEEFLSLCIGEWMTLRSSFELSGHNDNWHTSERSVLSVNLSPIDGKIKHITFNKQDNYTIALFFSLDGYFHSEDSSIGKWEIWPDGSLELLYEDKSGKESQRERIWFMKPNLRLRSIIKLNRDNTLLSAMFCSEIRRVNKVVI